MGTARKAERLHEIAARGGGVSTFVPTDLFYLSRQLNATEWDNNVINGADLTTQLTGSGTSIPGEDQIRDGWAVEFFEQYSVGNNPTLDQGIGWDGNGAGSGLSIASKSIYTGKSENRLVIANGQYGRKLFFGDSWNRIQIGLMFRINGLASFSADGYVGLCSGTTNMAASAVTDNFIGIKWATGVNSWVFTNGTKVNYYNQALSTRFSTRRAAGTTDQGGGSGSDGRSFSAIEGYRSMFFLEISRPVFATDASSVTYNLGMRSTNTTQVEMSLSKRTFVDVMLDGVASSLAAMVTGSVVMSASAVTNSFSFDQSVGKLDTLNVTWPNASETMEITALAVRKVY